MVLQASIACLDYNVLLGFACLLLDWHPGRNRSTQLADCVPFIDRDILPEFLATNLSSQPAISKKEIVLLLDYTDFLISFDYN
jgi:hypothetical protein